MVAYWVALWCKYWAILFWISKALDFFTRSEGQLSPSTVQTGSAQQLDFLSCLASRSASVSSCRSNFSMPLDNELKDCRNLPRFDYHQIVRRAIGKKNQKTVHWYVTITIELATVTTLSIHLDYETYHQICNRLRVP